MEKMRDIFICHASEHKKEVVRPIAEKAEVPDTLELEGLVFIERGLQFLMRDALSE